MLFGVKASAKANANLIQSGAVFQQECIDRHKH